MSRVGTADEQSARFLCALIDCVCHHRSISELLAPDVDDDAIRAQLQLLCDSPVVIESIAGNDKRIDAVVTNEREVARIVFSRNEHGLLTWLHAYVKPSRFTGVERGRLVVVNGPSGAGKSTLMVAMQSLASFPLVVLDEPEHIGSVQPGYLIWRDAAPTLHRGYLAAIRALATAGNHVALAAAGHDHEEISVAFRDVPLVRVGLHCDLGVLLDRERRTGRWAGIAAQSLAVHEGWTYDLEFDTTRNPDPVGLAEQVLQLIAR